MSKRIAKPLHYMVSGALLVGSLSACGGNEPQVNVAPEEHDPDIHEARESHDSESNGLEPVEGGMNSNEMPPLEEQPMVDEVQADPPTE